MWTKITSREQLINLPNGNIIVKYPVNYAEPLNVFDPEDVERISIRYVESNNRNVDTMNISLVMNMDIPGYGIPRFGDIFLSYEKIINSNMYWINLEPAH